MTWHLDSVRAAVPNVRRWGAEGGTQQGAEGQAQEGSIRKGFVSDSAMTGGIEVAGDALQEAFKRRGSSVRLCTGRLDY